MCQKKSWFGISGIVLLAMALALPVDAVAGRKYRILHRFGVGADGGYPQAGLIFDPAGNLYGTTQMGGDPICTYVGCGTVFKLTPNSDGSWTERVLHRFHRSDGSAPLAGLAIDAAGNLYGTTLFGGSPDCSQGAGCGTVFMLTPNSDGSWTESLLHKFRGPDGSNPSGGLIFDSAGNLYGTTSEGGNECGISGCGMVFKLTPKSDGSWGYSLLHRFHGADGSNPSASLIFDGAGNLYGTTAFGGDLTCKFNFFGCGTAFMLAPNSDGSWTERVLHRFLGHDGYSPKADLIFDASGNLYGTTAFGGTHDVCNGTCGTVFKLAPNSNGSWTQSVLHNFNGSDGYYPLAGLVFDAAGNLFGTTIFGGTDVQGVVFKVMPHSNGSWTESVIHSFLEMPALQPAAGLVSDKGGNLYGTTQYCGSSEDCRGVVFEITP